MEGERIDGIQKEEEVAEAIWERAKMEIALFSASNFGPGSKPVAAKAFCTHLHLLGMHGKQSHLLQAAQSLKPLTQTTADCRRFNSTPGLALSSPM